MELCYNTTKVTLKLSTVVILVIMELCYNRTTVWAKCFIVVILVIMELCYNFCPTICESSEVVILVIMELCYNMKRITKEYDIINGGRYPDYLPPFSFLHLIQFQNASEPL